MSASDLGSVGSMQGFPSFRKKILRSFTVLVALYALLGVTLVVAVLMASRNTPKVIHHNYDSIAAARRMEGAWNALRIPSEFELQSKAQWIEQFEKGLRFEEQNLTEPGEKATVQEVRRIWDLRKEEVNSPGFAEASRMRELLDSIVSANEKGMFGIAEQNARLARSVLFGAIAFFLGSLAVTVFFANRLATRLAAPIKKMAEVFHSRPEIGKSLLLPEAASQEVWVLSAELRRLWERLGEIERLNIDELVQEKRKLETVLESVEDALLVVDPDGKVTHSNQTLLDLIGVEGPRVMGHAWSELPSEKEEYLKLRSALHEDLTDGFEIELKFTRQKRTFSIRSRKIIGVGQKPVATLYLLRDITERRQRERLRSELIDLLSHELKTPLQSLGTAVELFVDRKDEFPEDLKILAETLSDDVDRIRGVANEFVQITQTRSKVMRLNLEKLPVHSLLVDWLKPFRIIAKDKGVRIEIQREGSDEILANIDPVKFPWVISNLVSNAIRFSTRGEVIFVKITDRNGGVEIKVKDQGPGIPPLEREKIFEPFYQTETCPGDAARGLLGVGLTIAREVVEAHDGRIEYHANCPGGSTFRILLPFPGLELG